tara:strand:- start:398 stop:598 length:201 start_codon:yes stop_codon:yes gene_type:complete
MEIDNGRFEVTVRAAQRSYFGGVHTFDGEDALVSFLLELKAAFRNKVDRVSNIAVLDAMMLEHEFV